MIRKEVKELEWEFSSQWFCLQKHSRAGMIRDSRGLKLGLRLSELVYPCIINEDPVKLLCYGIIRLVVEPGEF